MPLGRPSEQLQEKDGARDCANDDKDIVLHCGARTDDKLGESRQGFAPEHVRENRLKLWNNKDQQKAKNQNSNQKDDNRIEHRRNHLVLNLLGLFLKLGQAKQNELEHAAQLTSLYHVYVKLVKDLWMTARLSENAPPPCRLGKVNDHFTKDQVRACLARTVKPRKRGRPASISVASCRVKIMSVLPLMVLRSKNGIERLSGFFAVAGCRTAAFTARAALPPLPSSAIAFGK